MRIWQARVSNHSCNTALQRSASYQQRFARPDGTCFDAWSFANGDTTPFISADDPDFVSLYNPSVADSSSGAIYGLPDWGVPSYGTGGYVVRTRGGEGGGGGVLGREWQWCDCAAHHSGGMMDLSPSSCEYVPPPVVCPATSQIYLPNDGVVANDRMTTLLANRWIDAQVRGAAVTRLGPRSHGLAGDPRDTRRVE
jgi:hypothetical protein